MGTGLYIVTKDVGESVGIREGWNVKKCRPVVKGPSGGTLLFCFALPARGASLIRLSTDLLLDFASALPARGASPAVDGFSFCGPSLPRRCLHGVHRSMEARFSAAGVFASALPARGASGFQAGMVALNLLCLGAACTGCIGKSRQIEYYGL